MTDAQTRLKEAAARQENAIKLLAKALDTDVEAEAAPDLGDDAQALVEHIERVHGALTSLEAKLEPDKGAKSWSDPTGRSSDDADWAKTFGLPGAEKDDGALGLDDLVAMLDESHEIIADLDDKIEGSDLDRDKNRPKSWSDITGRKSDDAGWASTFGLPRGRSDD
jgi:hypothetical protein